MYFIAFCDGGKNIVSRRKKTNKTRLDSAIKALNIISGLEGFGAEGFIQARLFMACLQQ